MSDHRCEDTACRIACALEALVDVLGEIKSELREISDVVGTSADLDETGTIAASLRVIAEAQRGD